MAPEGNNKSFWTLFRPKLIGIIGVNIIIWAASKSIYPLPTSFGMMFSAFTMPFLVYFFISDKGFARGAGAAGTFIKTLVLHVVVSGGLMVGSITFVGSYVGLPSMFINTIIIFALLCLFLFILLEYKPPLKDPEGLQGVVYMIGVYLAASALYITATSSLPQYEPANEIKKLVATKLSLEGMSPEQITAAGKTVFRDFECANCHNSAPGGEVKRGPNLAEIDLGGMDKIRVSLTDPYKEILKPFADNPKVAKSMPDYYGDQMIDPEIVALSAFLNGLSTAKVVPTDKMPEGFWTNPEILAKGQQIYEGLFNEDVACGVCHGKDGVVQFEGARDFRLDKAMVNLTEARFFQVVQHGFEADSPMAGWSDYLSNEEIWTVISYVWSFYTKHTLKSDVPVERENPTGPDAIQIVEEKYWD